MHYLKLSLLCPTKILIFFKIPIVTLRAIVAQHLQYTLCARLTDLLRLRACDLTVTTLGDTPAMALNFRSSKTDPRYLELLYENFSSFFLMFKFLAQVCNLKIQRNFSFFKTTLNFYIRFITYKD